MGKPLVQYNDDVYDAILSRINVLAHKSRTCGLSKREQKEQAVLRAAYLEKFRQHTLMVLRGIEDDVQYMRQ